MSKLTKKFNLYERTDEPNYRKGSLLKNPHKPLTHTHIYMTERCSFKICKSSCKKSNKTFAKVNQPAWEKNNILVQSSLLGYWG